MTVVWIVPSGKRTTLVVVKLVNIFALFKILHDLNLHGFLC